MGSLFKKSKQPDDGGGPIPEIPARPDGHGLLGMVTELHRRGYEGLRICPYLPPHGCSWCCYLLPADCMEGGLEPLPLDQFWDDFDRDIPTYSSGLPFTIFGWEDAADDDAAALADKFIARFAKLAARSKLADKAYVRWFQTLLEASAAGLPYAWDDDGRVTGCRVLVPDGTYRELNAPPPPPPPRR